MLLQIVPEIQNLRLTWKSLQLSKPLTFSMLRRLRSLKGLSVFSAALGALDISELSSKFHIAQRSIFPFGGRLTFALAVCVF